MTPVLPRVAVVLSALLLVGCTGGSPSEPSELAREYFTDPSDVALATAVDQRDAEATRQLLVDGADPDATGRDDVTMVQLAVLAGSGPGLQALLEAGADPDALGYRGDAAIHLAATADDPALLKVLLGAGADPDVRNGTTQESALTRSLLSVDDGQFRQLMAAGADVDLADTNGGTALHQAARVNAGDHVLELLEAGADPLAVTSSGTTFQQYYFSYPDEVLSDTAVSQREAVVTWLEEHDVPLDPTATD